MKSPSLLSKINAPADLRKLNRAELPALAKEVREFVLQTVSLVASLLSLLGLVGESGGGGGESKSGSDGDDDVLVHGKLS